MDGKNAILNAETLESVELKFGDFLRHADGYFSEHSMGMIREALAIADMNLAGMARYDGTPMICHSTRTAEIVFAEIGLGRNSVISTLLHDVVRTGKMTAEEVGAMFGEQCVEIVKGLTNISDVRTKQSKEQAENFRDLIVSYSTDPRVILIKLADRLEVMRSLDMFPDAKRVKKSWESLNLYAQIAHKLGLYSIKSELEDISLRFLEPEAYAEIQNKLAESAEERNKFIEEFLKPIKDKLDLLGLKYTVKSRTKSVYSIWSKMRRMKIAFEDIFDIFAIRIIFDAPQEKEKPVAWQIYSVVTDFYTPNPDRMRDWISIPKSNGYESLHTTVVTKQGKWVEIQIRSERMDEVAERGIAAHWRYKGVQQGGLGSEQWLAKLRELMEGDTHGLATRFENTGSAGEIFVFTPNGDLRKLPEGATLLDFAFDIHSNLGATTIGGRVNHRNVQIREVLHNGDIVEILTSKTQKPKSDWLQIVKTGKARNKIRAYLREEQAKAASLGREELERKIKNWKLSISMEDAVTVLCKYYKVKTGTELYGQIADGKVDIADIKELLTRHLAGEQLTEVRGRGPERAKVAGTTSEDALIIDDTIKNLDYKLAKCCNPIRGDEVFGFVTINSGVTIHRNDCPNAARLKEHYPYRVLPAKWRDTKATGSAFQATIRVVADNVTGILNRITEVISHELKINIRSMSLSPNSKGELTGLINIEVTGTQIVDMVIYNIARIKGVQKAYRVNN